jgi:hypothetical protein
MGESVNFNLGAVARVRAVAFLGFLVLLWPVPATAQQGGQQQAGPCMPGMSMPGCPDSSAQPSQPAGLMTMHAQNFLQEIAAHLTSGTSAEPDSTPTPMLMSRRGPWMLMFHANAFLTDQQESSPRGADKLFSTNWFMPMAQRPLGPGVFTVRAMLSLEPATITDRQYPLLFQQGETAFGRPIADAQHPHNLIMEVTALYDLKLGENTLLSFYAAPVGDPALGPTAYPHRTSALEDPLAPLGHHQEDSTHISDDVVTVGLAYRAARFEASGFHGREPNENRWNVRQGPIDSWTSRFTFQPGKNWSGQYSYGRIKSPEALSPSEDQERMTASVMYNRPFSEGNWASTIVWGRTRSLPGNAVFASYLAESAVRFRARHYAWARLENVERSNELILGEVVPPPNFQEEPIGRVQAYTLGYDFEVHLIPHWASALGAQITTYGVPESLQPIYHEHSVGVAMFIRLRPTSESR